jgi:hypothetical protein
MSEQLAMNRAELVAGEARDQILQLFEQAPGFMALLEGSEYRFRFANLAFCHAFGKRDLAGKTCRRSTALAGCPRLRRHARSCRKVWRGAG